MIGNKIRNKIILCDVRSGAPLQRHPHSLRLAQPPFPTSEMDGAYKFYAVSSDDKYLPCNIDIILKAVSQRKTWRDYAHQDDLGLLLSSLEWPY